MPSLQKELLEATKAVLTTTKEVLRAEAKQSRVAIVGGLAVSHLTKHRVTADVDLYLGGNLLPQQLKRKLPQANSAFTTSLEAINGISYRSPTTKHITAIDFLDINVTAFEPRTRILDELKAEELPWATRDDLISMKVFSASKRDDLKKRLQDIGDTRALLLKYPGPLLFAGSAATEANKDFVKKFLPLLAQNSIWSEKEWQERLGL